MSTERTYTHAFVRSFVRSFVHSSVRSPIRSFVRSFVCFFNFSFARSLAHSFVHSFINSSIRLLLRSFVQLPARSFVHAFAGSLNRSFVRSSVRLCVGVTVHSYRHNNCTFVRSCAHASTHCVHRLIALYFVIMHIIKYIHCSAIQTIQTMAVIVQVNITRLGDPYWGCQDNEEYLKLYGMKYSIEVSTCY